MRLNVTRTLSDSQGGTPRILSSGEELVRPLLTVTIITNDCRINVVMSTFDLQAAVITSEEFAAWALYIQTHIVHAIRFHISSGIRHIFFKKEKKVISM